VRKEDREKESECLWARKEDREREKKKERKRKRMSLGEKIR
jgi:hypothetical protein